MVELDRGLVGQVRHRYGTRRRSSGLRQRVAAQQLARHRIDSISGNDVAGKGISNRLTRIERVGARRERIVDDDGTPCSVHAAGEVASALERGRQRQNRFADFTSLVALGRPEDERAATHDRTSHAAGPQVVVARRPRQVRLAREERVGKAPVRPIPDQAATAPAVGPGAVRGVEHPASVTTERRIVGVDLHADFFERLVRRDHRGPIEQVRERDAVEQVRVGPWRSAGNRQEGRGVLILHAREERRADGNDVGERGREEKRVASGRRQILERAAVDHRRHGGARPVDRGRLARHRDLFGNVANIQPHVDDQHLLCPDDQAPPLERLVARQRGGDRVDPWWRIREDVLARVVRDRVRRHGGRLVGQRQRDPGDDSGRIARRATHATVEGLRGAWRRPHDEKECCQESMHRTESSLCNHNWQPTRSASNRHAASALRASSTRSRSATPRPRLLPAARSAAVHRLPHHTRGGRSLSPTLVGDH